MICTPPDGVRAFKINNVPVVIRGGGFDPDLFLRYSPADIAKHNAEVERIGGKLADRGFTERAPEDVVETQRERLTREKEAIVHLEQALRDLS